jgi:diaminopropionate ammonia-lyase
MYLNPSASAWRTSRTSEHRVKSFHERMPGYSSTPLVSLDAVAKEIGIRHVFLKYEGSRFGLPAFKILGASWAIHCAVAKATDLPVTAELADLGNAARAKSLSLVTCSEGNWGRAVARMAKYLGIKAVVFVPQNCHEETKRKIESEGAKVPVVDGNYDASIRAALDESERTDALLVMDTSWHGYEEIPKVMFTLVESKG